MNYLNPCFTQDNKSSIEGYWYGLLEFQGSELILTFDIKKNEDGSLIGEVNSPLQGASHIPLTKILLNKDSVELYIKSLSANFKGRILAGDTLLDGIFSQAIFKIPMKLIKTSELFTLKRPQEPKPPYNYIEEEVVFENTKTGITLSGTLTQPKGEGSFPAVILISGSGPQDRNEEILGHKPFMVIADYLSNRDMAVLRFDDRGVGKSKGDFGTATSMDFASDVEAGVIFLKSHPKINSKKIGLIGHSEGGMIAPIVASRDKEINFIVLLAGPATSGEQVILSQIKKMLEVDNTDKEIIKTHLRDSKHIYKLLKRHAHKQKAASAIRKYYTKRAKKTPVSEHLLMGYSTQAVEIKIISMNSPWFRFFLTFEPETYLKNVDCPIFAMYGGKDVQVLAHENSEAMQRISKKNKKKNIHIKIYEGKNHLFQNAQKGTILEYAMIEETISEDVLKEMWEWIEIRVRSWE